MGVKKEKDVERKIPLGRMKGNLKMGLVGLPNVGKSSTFNLLSKQAVPAENYPFCTIDPHEARMNVSDPRFKWLCEHFHPKSEVAANLTVYDIAGLVPGAHQGEGLGNAFLSHIYSVDGIYHVVRVFEDHVVHTEGHVDPVRDMNIIHQELRLKDVDRLEQILREREKLRQVDKQKKQETDILVSVLEFLKKGRWIKEGQWKSLEVTILNEYQFLTAKPVIYLINMSEGDFLRQKNKWLGKVATWIKENNPGPIIPYSTVYEAKCLDQKLSLEPSETSKDITPRPSALEKIISTGYQSLGLIHYFTCGEDEVKCWTIRQETKAPQAAGLIHSDFERGFICAEVYKFDDLVQYKSEAALRAAGKIVQRGKDYLVEDGDIIFFKFNVSGSHHR